MYMYMYILTLWAAIVRVFGHREKLVIGIVRVISVLKGKKRYMIYAIASTVTHETRNRRKTIMKTGTTPKHCNTRQTQSVSVYFCSTCIHSHVIENMCQWYN